MERRHFLGCVGGVAAGASAVAAEQAIPSGTKTKETVCRITVVKRSVEQDLADRFRDGRVRQCDAFKDGQEFTVKQPWSPPEGFCQWAWADIRSYVMANFHGGDFPTVACCTDGFRPVFFRIECVEAKA
jgi:uncharacterized repeat protein (TIGR04076 family)